MYVCPLISAPSHIGITKERYQRIHRNTGIVLKFADFPKNASFKSYGVICLHGGRLVTLASKHHGAIRETSYPEHLCPQENQANKVINKSIEDARHGAVAIDHT